MLKFSNFLIKALILLACFIVLSAEFFTFLQFGSLRYPLSALTILIPFLISLKWIEYGILLLVFSTPIISLFYYSLDVRYSSLLAAMFLSVFLAWLVRLFMEPRLARCPLNRPLMAFAGAVLISLGIVFHRLREHTMEFVSGSELAFSIFRTGFVYLCGCAFFFLFVNNIRDEKALKRVIWTMLISGLGVGILGLVEYFGKAEVFYLLPAVVKERTVVPPGSGQSLIATFPNPNLLGNYTIFPLSLASGLTFMAKGRKRLLLGIVVVLGIFCLIFSANRTGWAGFTFAVAFGTWLAYRQGLVRYDLRKLFASGALVVYFLYASLMSSGIVEDLEKVEIIKVAAIRNKLKVKNVIGTTAGFRFPIWRQALRDWSERPFFGIGPGTFPYYRNGKYHQSAVVKGPTGRTVPANPHNYYLWILCETGTLGLGAFLWVLYRALKCGMERVRSAGGRWKFVYLGMVSSLAGYMLALAAGHTLGFLEMQIVFWAVVGMLVQGPKSEVQCL